MIYLRKTKYSIIILFLFIVPCFGQLSAINISDDTLNSSFQNEYRIKLNNNSKLYSPLFVIKQPMIFDEYSMFVIPNFNQTTNEENVSMLQLKHEINQTMNIYRQGQNRYQLGVVGDILGYVSTAAAAGLAVYHVHKYKKHYGLK